MNYFTNGAPYGLGLVVPASPVLTSESVHVHWVPEPRVRPISLWSRATLLISVERTCWQPITGITSTGVVLCCAGGVTGQFSLRRNCTGRTQAQTFIAGWWFVHYVAPGGCRLRSSEPCGALRCWFEKIEINAPINAIQYNTVQCNAMQCNATQYNTMQYNTIQHNTMQYNTIQHNTIQYNTIQHNTIQYNWLID